MKLQFQCPHCCDTNEIEFSVQKSDNLREFPVLMAVRSLTPLVPRMTELAATVMGNEMKRRTRHYRAGVQAKVLMGKVK